MDVDNGLFEPWSWYWFWRRHRRGGNTETL